LAAERFKVGYIIGSLATKSRNRLLAKALVRLAPPELEMTEVPIRDLPLYNYDYDSDFPAAGLALKASIEAADALLFLTPEYNRSMTGALKNAIDWASRPAGKNSFVNKPSASIGASSGAIGTAIAQQHLRGALAHLRSPQMTFPEGYIHLTPGLITDEGEVTVESTEGFLRKYMAEFHRHIGRVFAGLAKA
jgi:chromate reductase